MKVEAHMALEPCRDARVLVRAVVVHDQMQVQIRRRFDIDELKGWLASPFQRKLRNSLPNMDQEIVDACKAAVKARADELKPKENAS